MNYPNNLEISAAIAAFCAAVVGAQFCITVRWGGLTALDFMLGNAVDINGNTTGLMLALVIRVLITFGLVWLPIGLLLELARLIRWIRRGFVGFVLFRE